MERNLLLPGHLVGFYNPNSELNGIQKDLRSNPATFTHIATFMGENTENQLVFGQQIVTDRGMLTSEEMRTSGFRPKKVILDELLKAGR